MSPRKRARPNPAEGNRSSGTPIMPPSPRTRADSSATATSKRSGTGTPLPSQQESTDEKRGDGRDSARTTMTTSSSASTVESSQSSHKQQVGTRLPAVISGLSRPTAASAAPTDAKIRKTKSWYSSWPRKAGPSTQIARETMLGETLKTTTTADFSRFETRKNPDTTSIDEPPQTSPSAPVIPRIPENVASSNSAKKDVDAQQLESTDTYKIAVVDSKNPASDVSNKDVVPQAESNKPIETTPRPSTSSGWLGWFKTTEASAETPSANAQTAPEPHKPAEPEQEQSQEAPPQVSPPITSPKAPPNGPGRARSATESAAGGSWFPFWPRPNALAIEPEPLSAEDSRKPSEETEQEDVTMEDAPLLEGPSEPQPKAGSTWAFWSREPASTKTDSASKTVNEGGEIAVIGESSESHPRSTGSMEMKNSARPKEPPLKQGRNDETMKLGTSPGQDLQKKNKRGRPQSMEVDEPSEPSRPSTPTPNPDKGTTKPGTPKTPATTKSPGVAKTTAPNPILPSFGSTYRMKENPSILKQIAQLLLRTQSPPANHVFLSKDRPQIKKAIAIGVHGLFPAQYLRAMIGQPTGTSIRFANHCAEAIRRWTNAHGSQDCEIEKVALEGEGRINERVENLWRLLLNWIDHIRQADMIMVACHSQGVPVAIMLLAKLVEFGIVTSGVKIGVCAMAGVSLGPFPEYRSGMGMLMGSANELWEFSNPQSEVSQRLEVAVKAVLSYGARITFIGSIDDQLVPLESAFYSPAHHPYIYRAVFIDGRIHAPDFIAHLVGFALKLRNLGISDQGLIRELSIPLAGSLYGGEGHSRLYDDDNVYDLAIVHTLETTDVDNCPCEIHKYESLTNPNPYHLPWIMRGLLEQDFVKTELYAETAELLRQFDDWKPVNKALKDVKYRLEAVRSKL